MTQAEADDSGRAVVLVAVIVAAVTALDISKMNVGLFSIQHALGGSTTAIQLIVSGYALAFAIALLPAGRWGDVRSRRGPLLSGIVLLGIASLAGAGAVDVGVVVAARIFQGIAAGLMMPQAIGIVQDRFFGAERARMFGAVGAAIGVSTAIGPALGGLAIAAGSPEFGWRLLFLLNIPPAVAALVLVHRAVPVSVRRKAAPRLDLIGTVLIALTTLLIMLPFLSLGPWWWLALPLAALTAFGFIAWERRVARQGMDPAVDLALFGRAPFRLAMIVGVCYMAAVSSGVLLIVLYAQERLRLPAPAAGLMTVPFAIVAFALSLAGGRWAGARIMAVTAWALAACIVGAIVLGIVLLTVPPDWQWLANPLAFGIGGIGLGLLTASNQTLVLTDVPSRQGGVASSIGQVVQRLGTAIGPTIGYGVYASVVREQDDERVAFAWAIAVSVGFAVIALIFVLSAVLRAEQRGR